MTQQKSPGSGNNQGKDKKETDGMTYFYPLAIAAVNRNCTRCLYYHQSATARRRSFCEFTGEVVTPASAEAACTFWTSSGGDAA